MIFSYAARIYLMMMDHKLDFAAAYEWVCRRCPRNFQIYYRHELEFIISWEVGPL